MDGVIVLGTTKTMDGTGSCHCPFTIHRSLPDG